MIKINLIKFKTSSHETIKKMNRQTTDWEKIFAKHTYDKRLVSGLSKEYLQLNVEKTKHN